MYILTNYVDTLSFNLLLGKLVYGVVAHSLELADKNGNLVSKVSSNHKHKQRICYTYARTYMYP